MENNKNTKIALSVVIMLIITIASVITSVVMYELLKETMKEAISSNNYNINNYNINNEEVVGEIEFIEIKVNDPNGDGSLDLEPLKIESEDLNRQLKIIINSSSWCEDNSENEELEDYPIITIHQKDGEKLYIIAADGLGTNGANIISVSKNKDLSDKKFYKIYDKLGTYIEKVYNENIDATNS